MTSIPTTLNAIRAHDPCKDGWEKLLAHLGKTAADDEPLLFSTIVESNGVEFACWCLRALPKEHQALIPLIAADFAESVLHIYEARCPDDLWSRRAIESIRAGKKVREVGRINSIAVRAAVYTANAIRDARLSPSTRSRRAAEGAVGAATNALSTAYHGASTTLEDSAACAACAAERKKQAEILIKYLG